MKRIFAVAALAAAAMTGGATASTLIIDDFQVNSSSSYAIVNDGTPDGTQQFAFDYTAVGIPLAPRSAVGGGRGLRLTANDTVKTTNLVDAWTLFHNTNVAADVYTMRVDVWMNFAVASASTEHAHVGVAGNGTTFNSVFTPVSGSGAFLAFTGDGGSGSDYRWFRAAANSFADDPATAPAIPSTTLANSHPSYLGRGSDNLGTFFSNLFPLAPRTAPSAVGSPGNQWTTVEITVNNLSGVIEFSMSNPLQGTPSTLVYRGLFANQLNGRVSLGLADTFTSVDAGSVFTLYDNLEVFVPEPATGMMLIVSAMGLVRRRR
jgi:hypothetical protein